jgi:hypothetical protein
MTIQNINLDQLPTAARAPPPQPPSSGHDGDNSEGDGLVRLTAYYTQRAYRALLRVTRDQGDTETDTLNRLPGIFDRLLLLARQGGGKLSFSSRDGKRYVLTIRRER